MYRIVNKSKYIRFNCLNLSKEDLREYIFSQTSDEQENRMSLLVDSFHCVGRDDFLAKNERERVKKLLLKNRFRILRWCENA